MSRMSRYFSEHTTAATIFRTSVLIAAVIAGASSAASPAAAQSFFERLFGAPEARPEARTPATRKPGDTVIRSRDQSGNPGPAYRVLGVVPKTPKPNLSQGERLKQKIAQDLLKAPPAPPTQGPLLLTVSIAKQTVTLYDGGVAVAKSPVSTGTPERPTPTGIFSVIEKQWWHRSNLYSAAPMPFMQRITWSGVALHAGELPGYAASHGCIRLPESFALRLWGTTKIGARVIITRDEVAPLEIKHARLFTLKPAVEPVPVPAPEIKPDEIVPPEYKPEDVAPPENKPRQEEMSVSIDAPVRQLASRDAIAADTIPSDASTPEASSAMASAPVASPPVASPPVAVTEYTAPPVADEEEPADTDIDDETRQALQKVELVDPDRTVINGTTEVTITLPGQRTQTVLLSVERMPNDAGSPLVTEPNVMLASLDGSLLPLPARSFTDQTQLARRRTAPQSQPAEPVSTQPKVLRPGPLSILISRKEQRMYVRKGFEPLFEVPVNIGKASEPIGTHVFTAVAGTDDPAALRWMVVSLDPPKLAAAAAPEARNVAGKRAPDRADAKLRATAAARAALDRLDLPQDAVARITDLMSVGATLIVSDKGIGRRAAAALDSDFMIEMPL